MSSGATNASPGRLVADAIVWRADVIWGIHVTLRKPIILTASCLDVHARRPPRLSHNACRWGPARSRHPATGQRRLGTLSVARIAAARTGRRTTLQCGVPLTAATRSFGLE